MKLSKKQWTIIGIVVVLIAIWYFFLRKKKDSESSFDRTKEGVKTNRAFVNTKTNRAFLDRSNPISTPQANIKSNAPQSNRMAERLKRYGHTLESFNRLSVKEKMQLELRAMKAEGGDSKRIQQFEQTLASGDTQRLAGGDSDCYKPCQLWCWAETCSCQIKYSGNTVCWPGAILNNQNTNKM